MRRGVGTAVKTTKMPLLTKNSRRARWDKIFSGEPCTGGGAPLCLCSNNKILWPEGRSFVRVYFGPWLRCAWPQEDGGWTGLVTPAVGNEKTKIHVQTLDYPRGALVRTTPKNIESVLFICIKWKMLGTQGRQYAFYGKTFYPQNTLFLAPQVLSQSYQSKGFHQSSPSPNITQQCNILLIAHQPIPIAF